MSEPTITTSRTVLRPANASDTILAIRLLTDRRVRQFLGGPRTLTDATRAAPDLLKAPPGGTTWCVLIAKTRAGLVSLTRHKDGKDVELSYQFLPRHWGKGFALESTSAAVSHGFGKMDLPRIIAETQSANSRSIRLLNRLGFKEQKRLIRFGAEQTLLMAEAPTAQ